MDRKPFVTGTWVAAGLAQRRGGPERSKNLVLTAFRPLGIARQGVAFLGFFQAGLPQGFGLSLGRETAQISRPLGIVTFVFQ